MLKPSGLAWLREGHWIGCFRQFYCPPPVSPISADKFSGELHHHPDPHKVDFVLSGVYFGFLVGFLSSSVSWYSAFGNKPSALSKPAINGYQRNELLRGHVACPYQSPPLNNLQMSHFGIIPKKYQTGKWSLILDLSTPLGCSFNDEIPKEAFSLQIPENWFNNFLDGIIKSYGHSALKSRNASHH